MTPGYPPPADSHTCLPQTWGPLRAWDVGVGTGAWLRRAVVSRWPLRSDQVGGADSWFRGSAAYGAGAPSVLPFRGSPWVLALNLQGEREARAPCPLCRAAGPTAPGCCRRRGGAVAPY